jgi:hypothetical protein
MSYLVMIGVPKIKMPPVCLPHSPFVVRIQGQLWVVPRYGQLKTVGLAFWKGKVERVLRYRLLYVIFLSLLLAPASETFALSFKAHLAGAISIPLKSRNKGQVILIQNMSASLSVENVTGPPGTLLPVRVNVSSSLLSKDGGEPSITFSGLPDSCRLSAGNKRTRSWSVPIDKLDGLMLMPAAGCKGDFKVLIMIFDGKDVRSDIMRTILFSIHADESVPPLLPHPAPTEARIPVLSVSPALEEALLKKGQVLLKIGDVSAARLSFETLALRGSAKGAFALAQSYDPAVLHSVAIAGLKPDLAKAKEWYAKAAELGNEDAVRRLSALKFLKQDTPLRE